MSSHALLILSVAVLLNSEAPRDNAAKRPSGIGPFLSAQASGIQLHQSLHVRNVHKEPPAPIADTSGATRPRQSKRKEGVKTGVVKKIDGTNLLLIDGQRFALDGQTRYAVETGRDPRVIERSHVSAGQRVTVSWRQDGDKRVAVLVLVDRLQPTTKETSPLTGTTRQQALTVTVIPKHEQVHRGEYVEVRLRVRNTSRAAQSFRIMNCSWDEHWQSSNKQVTWVGWDCSKNFAVDIRLKPGDAYEKTLALRIGGTKPEDEVRFAMGFTPIGSKKTYWSRPVRLRIVR